MLTRPRSTAVTLYICNLPKSWNRVDGRERERIRDDERG